MPGRVGKIKTSHKPSELSKNKTSLASAVLETSMPYLAVGTHPRPPPCTPAPLGGLKLPLRAKRNRSHGPVVTQASTCKLEEVERKACNVLV